MTNYNRQPAALRVGDKVRSDFHREEKALVRTLTAVGPDSRCGSGYRASADDGGTCRSCRRPLGYSISGVDAAWFNPVVMEQSEPRGKKPAARKGKRK